MNKKLLYCTLCVVASTSGESATPPVVDPLVQDLPAWEQAAKEGDIEAKFKLGRAYYRGEGAARDLPKAIQLIGEAAEAGSHDAVNSMGYFYQQGEGVAKDENKAVAWFKRGVASGSAQAKLNLGLMLRQGKTIQLSNHESLKWMHAAADQGLPEARAYLGRLYFGGDALMNSDYRKAHPHLLEAANAGDPVCQNMMGILCRDGVGPDAEFKNEDEAITWFRKAAMQNDRKAQSNLAHSLGVVSPSSPNRAEALKWLIVAMDQGEITAKKTYDEIGHIIPSEMMEMARRSAVKQMIILNAKSATP
jgi:TPR repeat protein